MVEDQFTRLPKHAVAKLKREEVLTHAGVSYLASQVVNCS
jgi:hypothetical protein